MPRGLENINISRAANLTNLFYLFFHGGKSAVIPFITLFFRLIGLSAFQVGIIVAAKTLTSLIWAPLWARCAVSYNRQRFVLMFSLFMVIITNLTFPALYTQISQKEHCDAMSGNNSVSGSFITTVPQESMDHGVIQTTASSVPESSEKSSKSTSTTLPPKTITGLPATTTTTTTTASTTPIVSSTSGKLPSHTDSTDMEELYEEALNLLKLNGVTPTQVLNSNLDVPQMYELVKNYLQGSNVTQQVVGDLYHMLLDREGGGGSEGKLSKENSRQLKGHVRHRRSEWNYGQIREKLFSIQNSLRTDTTLLCLVVLAIVIVGEIFSSPVEKVADDSWFEFLNRIDDLERYGQQRFWGSIAFVIVPIIVTVAVDHTPCFLPFHLHHFLLHFYILAVLMGAALIISCCYPVPPPASTKYNSKICKALRIVCCDGRGFLFSVTLLIAGMVYASFHNFLFWRIQDLGGSETTMGFCVSAGAFAEIPMLLLSSRLVKRLGNGWAVSFALFVLSARVACYSAIPFPWAFVPVELSHGITHTMLWFAVLSYDDFNVGASIDRSIRTIMSSFYFGFGFSIGSLVSGCIYDAYGFQVLYWSASVVTIGWCLFYSVVQRCLPKKEKIRYIKLLHTDSDNSDDDDDWLEMALKEK